MIFGRYTIGTSSSLDPRWCALVPAVGAGYGLATGMYDQFEFPLVFVGLYGLVVASPVLWVVMTVHGKRRLEQTGAHSFRPLVTPKHAVKLISGLAAAVLLIVVGLVMGLSAGGRATAQTEWLTIGILVAWGWITLGVATRFTYRLRAAGCADRWCEAFDRIGWDVPRRDGRPAREVAGRVDQQQLTVNLDQRFGVPNLQLEAALDPAFDGTEIACSGSIHFRDREGRKLGEYDGRECRIYGPDADRLAPMLADSETSKQLVELHESFDEVRIDDRTCTARSDGLFGTTDELVETTRRVAAVADRLNDQVRDDNESDNPEGSTVQ